MRAVVFDLDDTLYPERRYVRSGYRAVADALREALKTDEPYGRWLWRRFESGRSNRAFDALNEQFALGLSEQQIARLVAVYRGHAPDIRPYEGAAELLADLRGRVRLGLLSDGPLPAQQLKLDALALGECFDAVVWTDELAPDRRAWKPSPLGFEAISASLAVAPASCAYVADNPAKDFVAPNALGWRTVRVVFSGQVHGRAAPAPGGEPTATVRSWAQLRRALDL